MELTTHHKNGGSLKNIFRILGVFRQTRRGAAALILSLALAGVLPAASVKDYGAIGNGVADDTAALQRAINGTTSGILTFPAGTYKISSTLPLRSNMTYQGEGKAVLTGAVTIMAMPNNASMITISALTFDGGQLLGQGVSTNIKVTGCTFRNVTLYKTGNWTLRNAVFTAGSFRNSSFDHNTFSNVLPNGNTRPDGTGNSIGDTNYGMWFYGLDNTSVDHNTFDYVGEGIKLCQAQTYPATNVYIGHNVFTHIHRMGMELQGAVGCGGKITIQPDITNLTVENNSITQFIDYYWDSFGISEAMPPPDGCSTCVIRNNYIVGLVPSYWSAQHKAGHYGYGIESGGLGLQVYGNTIAGVFDLAVGVFVGSTNATVHDNYACMLDSGANMGFGQENGLSTGATFTGNTLLSSCPTTLPNPIPDPGNTPASASLSPSSISFNSQQAGTSSSPQTITLTNNGSAALALSGIGLTGTSMGSFSQTNTCGSSLIRGASCKIQIVFQPQTAGSKTATLSVKDNAADSPHGVTLSGTATSNGSVTTPPSGKLPTDLPKGMLLWLASDAGVLSSGNAVSAWEDQSGNGNDALQVQPKNQPTIVAGNNGQKAIRFDGTSSFLSIPSLPIEGDTSLTVFLVAANFSDRTSGYGMNAFLYWPETASWGSTFFGTYQTSSLFRFGTMQTGNSPSYKLSMSHTNSFALSEWMHAATVDSLWINGQALGSYSGKAAAIAGTRNDAYLGQGSNNTFFPGEASELIIYNRALTNTERQKIEQYLMVKYHL